VYVDELRLCNTLCFALADGVKPSVPVPPSLPFYFFRGWLKTVDEYATGANNSIQHTNTNLEYDTVMQCLALNPDRKFIAVEQA